MAGTTKGFDQRIQDSYSEITVERVRKYFLSSDKFCRLYDGGNDGTTAFKKMTESRNSHRRVCGGSMSPTRSKKVYDRKRKITLKLFTGDVLKFEDLPKKRIR